MKLIFTYRYLIAFCLGLLTVLGFAPFSLFFLAIFSLAALFWQWQQANDRRAAALLGFFFGFGLFGAGIGWLYIAQHDYGDMPFLLALLTTALFAAFLALFPALIGYTQARLRAPSWARLTLVMPALWVLLEWIRGLLFTGFPWLTLAYSQASASPLVGYAPIFGVYGVSLAVTISAGLLVLLWKMRWNTQGQAALVALLVLWSSAAALRNVDWTKPEGEPFKVALLQGNISQDLKFHKEKLVDTLETYRRLVLQTDARLIILPETALPLLRHDLPENYMNIFRKHARQNDGDILIGAFESDNELHYNSVFTLGTANSQNYRKNHLVPFGEFIPLRPVLGWIVNEVLQIPMSDLARGGERQPVLRIAGQRVAVQICYEDVFGEEVIRYLPEASLLVNVSNDAWYGKSHAAIQHNQIAQMRALETGRMMLRATNTGVTSIIRRDGSIQQMLPQHEEGVLTGQVQGYIGSTPYVRWGNAAMLIVLLIMLVLAKLAQHRPHPYSPFTRSTRVKE
ncbi:apolipoprotein N-acyltransferase [Candidatus Nitrotoga sp. M5]|uniref:apolipoprotein N-acyltransferase n=1 Tax=Candidatus Nitrotoga sp. M5 TaxID=2890409 RepID=UPI001EF71200|nr:apolipoprotein N-acyltransferase [Candidatus Nitrotoga sp. M5]CAH1387587.1 Apolipoprotein N-acyltransferase [Candidatus Nitrotoga sp. M5]